MASPLFQAIPKSPLRQKTPVFRRLTVGATDKSSINSTSPNRLSPNVGRSVSVQLGGSPASFLNEPQRSPSTEFSVLGETPTLSSSFGIKQTSTGPGGFRYRPSLSETPNNRGKHSAKFWNQASPNVFSSPAVALKFCSTPTCSALIQSPCRIGAYSVDRRRLYHQDSPPEEMPVRRNHQLSELPDDTFEIGKKRECTQHCRKSSLPTPKSTPKLGNGGFGSVFFAKYGGERVAIKQLHNRKKDDRAKEESFCAELNAFRLHHPNIVRILTFTSCGLTTQVVFEYVGPQNLQQILESNPANFSHTKALVFTSEVAEALHYCHSQRIVHLDVKAANVLVNESEDHCKLGDFGCSRAISPSAETLPPIEAPPGTMMFQAPEILKGKAISFKADVYSFGILVWECLSKKLPFEGIHPHTIVFLVVSRGLRPDCKILEKAFKKKSLGWHLLRLAQMCWVSNPDYRPNFELICHEMSNFH